MRNWIILAILIALAYYLYTKSDDMKQPTTENTSSMVDSTTDKLDKAADAQMATLEAKAQSLKATIDAKLSDTEKQAYDLMAQSKEKIKQFVDNYCTPDAPQSNSFSKESQEYICKQLQN